MYTNYTSHLTLSLFLCSPIINYSTLTLSWMDSLDGYSRMIMFLQATSNRADTMLRPFQKGVMEFGLPSRVRMDKGGENVLVAQYIMLECPERGGGRGSVIVGRSIHNQRIERLWRNLFSGCISFFYYFFYFLEDCGLLHVNDELDVYALKYAFLPIIQEQLHSFRSGWSQHSMRTENNHTPMQLWVAGLLEKNREISQHPAITETDAVSVSVPYCYYDNAYN